MTWSVYALCEPSTGEIRYIGVSANPKKRLTTHLTSSAAPLLREWIRDLGKTRPSLAILATKKNERDALALEMELIAQHKKTLLNETPGGELGGRRARKFSGIDKRVARLVAKRDISGRELGRRTGISCAAISRIVNGIEAHIEAETAVLLARALNTTVEYLVTGTS